MEEDSCYFTDEPKFYVFKYCHRTYVLIDLEGSSKKNELEKIIEEHLKFGLSLANEQGKLYNPYRDIEKAMDVIAQKYNLIVVRDIKELYISKRIKDAIKRYNEAVRLSYLK